MCKPLIQVKITSLGVLLSMLLLGSGCSTLGPDFKQTESEPVSVKFATNHPDSVISRRVVWGGRVISVEHLQDSTRLEIIAFPLNSRQKPKPPVNSKDLTSTERFYAVKRGYIEPLDSHDRLVTVAGKIRGFERLGSSATEQKVPVMAIERLHLWSNVEKPNIHFNFGFVLHN